MIKSDKIEIDWSIERIYSIGVAVCVFAIATNANIDQFSCCFTLLRTPANQFVARISFSVIISERG